MNKKISFTLFCLLVAFVSNYVYAMGRYTIANAIGFHPAAIFRGILALLAVFTITTGAAYLIRRRKIGKKWYFAACVLCAVIALFTSFSAPFLALFPIFFHIVFFLLFIPMLSVVSAGFANVVKPGYEAFSALLMSVFIGTLLFEVRDMAYDLITAKHELDKNGIDVFWDK